MDRKKAICEYLRQNHIGKENAIHSKELEKLFMLDGRNIRRKISALRQDGFPICSDETGYYYADNQKEINHTVCRLNFLTVFDTIQNGLHAEKVQKIRAFRGSCFLRKPLSVYRIFS